MNILITGGTGGVGRAAVELLAQDSCNHIYFTYCHNEVAAQQVMQQFDNTTAVQCDFSNAQSLDVFLLQIADMNLDVLVNNAWANKPGGIRFHKLTQELITGSMNANILSTIAVTQKVLETFRKKKNGHIISIITSSVIGVPPLGYALYSSCKAFIAQMAKSWALEYGKMGIASNCISPDFMETEFTVGTDERVIEQLVASHPLKRLLDPMEVAEVICFLAYASTQINGVNIPLTAGMRMQ